MPPKRKYTSYVRANKKQSSTPSAVFTAKAANKAHLQAELTNLLAGQEYSQSGYVYVTVNTTENSVSFTEPSQDPIGSQTQWRHTEQEPYQEELILAEDGNHDDDETQFHPDDPAEDLAEVELPDDNGADEAAQNLPLGCFSQQQLCLVSPPDSSILEISRPVLSEPKQLGAVDQVADHKSFCGTDSQVLNVELGPLNLTLSSVQAAHASNGNGTASGAAKPVQQNVGADAKIVATEVAPEVEIAVIEIVPETEAAPAEVAIEADCDSCRGRTDELRKLRKKISAQAHEIACLKDNLAFITGELQDARDNNKFPSIAFTTDSNIDMSIDELKAIDSASQTDSIFVANLAIHFYGTEHLKTMSVTGQPTPRFKNLRKDDGSLLYPPREQIETKVFKFISEKLVERVAQRLGPSKVKEIAYFANDQIVRKHIAQKIGNLNKVAARRRD